MNHFRLVKNVPDIYVKESRDFQLFCNIFDLWNNAVKFNIDSILSILNTDDCPDKLLPLLKTKLGFFTDTDIPNAQLRVILKNFPYMVRKKGCRKGIYQAILTYLKCLHINTDCSISILNTNYSQPIGGNYIIEVGMNRISDDIYILKELFRYILPPGYDVNYYLYSKISPKNIITSSDRINIIIVDEDEASGVVDSEDIKDALNFISQSTVIMSETFEDSKVKDESKLSSKRFILGEGEYSNEKDSKN